PRRPSPGHQARSGHRPLTDPRRRDAPTSWAKRRPARSREGNPPAHTRDPPSAWKSSRAHCSSYPLAPLLDGTLVRSLTARRRGFPAPAFEDRDALEPDREATSAVVTPTVETVGFSPHRD